MSDFGQRVISGLIGSDVPRIYHGVDTETFHPVSPGHPLRTDRTLRTKDDCKAWLGFEPGRKMLLRADRNVVRKNYDVLLSAFVDIARADPDVDLVLHCRPIDNEGIDLWQEILRMPEDLRSRVKFTNAHDTFKGLTTEGLAALYNAADLYVSTTGGEGFGLTLAEALACGTPVVATGWAAEIEVIGDGGIIIPPLHDSYGQPVRYHSRFGMDWAVPDGRAFVEPIVRLLARPAHRRALGTAGRLHVQRSFSWDTAADQFLDVLGVPDAAAA
jgi:glycosyltransferase involved in cell wall biosynthesis